MHHAIVVPLNSKNICLEYEVRNPKLRATHPENYEQSVESAIGPIKVTTYEINLADPLKVTIERARVSKAEWKQLCLENRAILSHTHAMVAQLDTALHPIILKLQNFEKITPHNQDQYSKLLIERNNLKTSVASLNTRKYIHEAMIDLELRVLNGESNLSFDLTD